MQQQKLPWIDGHLDLAYLAVTGRDATQSLAPNTDACISLPALREANIEIAFATIFTELDTKNTTPLPPHMYRHDDAESAHNAGVLQLQTYEQLEQRNELPIVRTRDDLARETALPKIVILMEGADPIRSPEEVPWWHERGVRVVGLTWAIGSRYAGGNAGKNTMGGGGLTPIGRELITALDEHNIVHDASHLSEQAFWEVLEHARGRIVATHSNSRALVPTTGERNLSDAQIRAIAERNGIIGLNLFSKFLAADRQATIDDCADHIEHICAVMGHRQGIALGSDMDGGFGASHLPQNVDHPRLLFNITDALHKRGWSDDEVAGFAHENWRRFLTETL